MAEITTTGDQPGLHVQVQFLLARYLIIISYSYVSLLMQAYSIAIATYNYSILKTEIAN